MDPFLRTAIRMRTDYEVECWRRGRLLWEDRFHNLVVTAGLNKLLDACFKTGLAAPAWYLGLVNNTSFVAYAAADTMASHGGWLEGTPYSDGTRPALVLGAIAAGSVDNAASRATFNINAAQTVRGGFLTDSATKGGATGTLYGAGDFTIARAVLSGDVLLMKATLTAVSA